MTTSGKYGFSRKLSPDVAPLGPIVGKVAGRAQIDEFVLLEPVRDLAHGRLAVALAVPVDMRRLHVALQDAPTNQAAPAREQLPQALFRQPERGKEVRRRAVHGVVVLYCAPGPGCQAPQKLGRVFRISPFPRPHEQLVCRRRHNPNENANITKETHENTRRTQKHTEYDRLSASKTKGIGTGT